MKLTKRQRKHGTKLSIASLIDVVFLLIIFFMTVSQIKPDKVEGLELPEAKQGLGQVETEIKRVVFNVLADGRVLAFGKELSADDTKAILAEEVSIRTAENVTVLIRADRNTDWVKVRQIMTMCAKNGIRNVRAAVVDDE